MSNPSLIYKNHNISKILGPKLTKEERLAKTQREKTPAGKVLQFVMTLF